MFKISTWNVNSITARLDNLLEFIKLEDPDIILLQELKTLQFPYLMLEHLGYNIAVNLQKTYNGVAVFSKYKIEETITSFKGDPNPEQARFIEAVITINNKVLRAISLYVPNGQDLQSDKFGYKLEFLDNFLDYAKQLLKNDELICIGGDYNVAPAHIDIYARDRVVEALCFSLEERKRMWQLSNMGYIDAFRAKNPHDPGYTWWDYRAGAYQKDLGLRIDHLFLSPELADLHTACKVNKEIREQEKPSDHAPVTSSFKV